MRESCSSTVADRYVKEREKLRLQLSVALKSSMAKLVGSDKFADIFLKSSDGVQIPAHLCILKNRSPGFFRCYIERAIGKSGSSRGGQAPIIDIPDADSNSLQFFLKCVYSEEDAPSSVQDAIEKYSDRGPDEDEDKADDTHMESDEQKQDQLAKSTDSTSSKQTFILNNSTSSGAGFSSMAQQGSDNEQPHSISEITESTVIEPNMLLSPESQPFDSEDVSPDTLALDTEPEEEDVRKRPRLQANSTVPHMISFADLNSAGSEDHEEVIVPVSSRSLMNEDNLSDSMEEDDSPEEQAQQRSHEDEAVKQSETRGEMKRSGSRDEKMIAQFIPLSDPGEIGAAFENSGVIDDSKKMFSMFIEIERKRMPGMKKTDSTDEFSKETTNDRQSSGRKRWSTISSMDRISLGSQDLVAYADTSMTDDSISISGFSIDESGNAGFDDSDQTACSKLGHDLLRLFLDQLDCDMQVLVDDKSFVQIQK